MQACGVPPETFGRICELLTENSGPDRTTAFVYSVGWTQHTVGVQYIRTASILQALLGNMGRPGGGILALRGHASIQVSTDIPTLFDLLPGYLPMPFATTGPDLDRYIEVEKVEKGFWANTREYTVSLLKAWWGDAATADRPGRSPAVPLEGSPRQDTARKSVREAPVDLIARTGRLRGRKWRRPGSAGRPSSRNYTYSSLYIQGPGRIRGNPRDSADRGRRGRG